ncbi:MAG: CDP-glycerol glycerophosphotransferase family protein [Actinomycetota bacterium]|nr:CDP-glycerol glycerophosphotransferase family protein [Actinomycetota bacterium]
MTDPTLVLSSWHGRHSDSPRAIARELARRGAPLRQAWIAADDVDLPAGVDRVHPGGEEERAALGAARWIVSNDVLPLDFAKAPGATYLQTWHGTPLKRIGFDVRHPTFPDAEYHYAVELRRDVARWDVLLSPNRFSTEVLRRAFRFGGEILETGYPRNDALQAPDRDAVRAQAREALEVADDVRLVLYAPTWRDSFRYSQGLDLDALATGLGPEVVVLVRAHGLTAASAGRIEAPGVRDVTRWPDITELYLASDVLLTDYSSAMFDFAVTRKPQLFYVYDLDHYRDRMRGFTFDFEAEAPGPLLRTTDEVLRALRAPAAPTAACAEAYDRFVARFCHLDDGRASARVVDAVFGPAADVAGEPTRSRAPGETAG